MKVPVLFGSSREPIVYEVRLEIDPGIAGDFDDWLREHVREMLAFPGFQSATVYRGQDFTESHRLERLAVYEVRSRRELESYLHTHATLMRKDGVNRFGNRFDASRRILPVAGHALPEGFTLLYDRNHISGGLPVCGNCHQPVAGRFCIHCGQEDRTFMLSLTELLRDLVGDLFNYDSRFFRTMQPLLLRPGWVTREYLRGRRQQYLPPVRMYIFASLVFFFVAALQTNGDLGDEVNFNLPATDTPANLEELSPEQRERVERELERTEELTGLPAGTLKIQDKPQTGTVTARNDGREIKSDDDVNFSLGGLVSPEFEERLERGARAVNEDPQQYVENVMRQIPTVMLFFLPVIALILKLLYILSGRYYVEHLIFTLHFHSAVFVLLLLWLLYDMLASAWTLLAPLSSWIVLALWIYIPYYLYKSLRAVYGQGRFLTVLKFMLLVFTYFLAMIFAAVVTFVYALYNQA